jgi:hypothetical protein
MHLETIKGLLIFFIIALIASGITAIPIDTELKYLIGPLACVTALPFISVFDDTSRDAGAGCFSPWPV